jgi:phage gpG-like protein
VSRSSNVVGESDSKLLTYAAANEYGANIAITDKMRKFLHWIGIHVKNETTHIIIPERSYIRSTFDNKLYYQELRKKLQSPFEQVLNGERDPETLLDLIGLQYVANVRRTIRDMKEPENHPVTIERKGKGKGILVDSGRLVRSISYEVTG